MAVVFDIEHYATEDGPGIRTVVFFKGCNLRCRWCQNPESQSPRPQVMLVPSRCVACGRCVQACPEDAILTDPEHAFLTDHERCTLCGACVDACYTGARRIVGRDYTLDEIMAEIEKDVSFYRESRGGVTFSGGEPLLQADAVAALAERCRAQGIHTAVETAGHVPWSAFERVHPHTDLLFFDLKHVDGDDHRAFVGVMPDRILDNIARASRTFESIIVRIPVVPGVNDDDGVMRRIFAFLAEETEVRTVQFLPFHRLGQAKYEGLGIAYEMGDTASMDRAECEPYAAIGRAAGLNVQVGGGD